MEQLTLFTGDTLVSLLVLPGSEKARQMTVTSGQKYFALYKPSTLGGSLVRMLLGTSHWGSTLCLLTWKVSVTPGKRLLFQLSPWMPDIAETEYSLWPTPRASDATHGGPNQRDSKGNYALTGAVHHPEAKMWPTPTASQDWKPVRKLAPSEANGSHGTMLVGAVGDMNPELIGGQLNPQWVEWLMGFPIGWTDLKPLETQSFHSKSIPS